jgi:hypothetical protein
VCGLVAAALLGLVVVPVLPAAAPTEHEVKAAFLYHFAQLVDWPDDALPPGKPFVLAVVGDDPFGSALDDVVAAQQVRGHLVRIERYPNIDSLAGTPHMLFVGASAGRELQRTLDAVARGPVLTIGEMERFAERGGMIGFRMTPEGRVTFDINRKVAERARLKLSSQLLKLARIVDGGP